MTRFAYDVASGMPTFGIPEMYHIAEAMYEGDTDALKYHLSVAGTVHALWYGGYQMAKAWEFYRHGRSMMSFHTAMSQKGPLMSQGLRAFLVSPYAVPVAAAIGTVAYADMLSDPNHPHTRGLVQERKAGVVSLGGPAFF